MVEITLTVNKANVYNEVAKTTSYTGNKMTDADAGAYDRVFTADADREMLERFWTEACNAVTGLVKNFIVSVSELRESHDVELDNNYVVTLELSSSYDTNLTQSIESSLFSFFVTYIVGKWFRLSNKDEAQGYMDEASNMLEDAMNKVYYRKKPKRVVPVVEINS